MIYILGQYKMQRYLTKSEFKLALECETKLYYFARKDEYANQGMDNQFLKSLADGGFQVGTMAQFLLAEDPVTSGIEGHAISKEDSLKETTERLLSDEAAMAEASLAYENFFIRADLVRKTGTILELYEVKAKAYGGDRSKFWKKKTHEIDTKWLPYFYDVAFQTWVIRQAHPEWKVRPFLVLADRTRRADVDGLNQCFRILGKNSIDKIEIKPGLQRKDLGTMLVTPVDVSEEVELLLSSPVNSPGLGMIPFEAYVTKLAEEYIAGRKIATATGKKCKDCMFRSEPGGDDEKKGLKSGFHECWLEQCGVKPEAFRNQSILDLWNYRKTDEEITNRRYFLTDLADDIDWSAPIFPANSGLTAEERQRLQVQMAVSGNNTPFLIKKGLADEMAAWVFPLHFIDFETSAPALPFTKGHRPYETIAFQFSMHNVYEDGRIEHAAQFLDDRIGEHPNYEFLRHLKAALEHDKGTVFRYAAHENSVLSQIRISLFEDLYPPSDRDELVAFIETIIHYEDERGKKVFGPRAMVDMLELVKLFFYHPTMKGSNSIKKVLPAAITSSGYLREKYSKPIYGTSEIPSLNVKKHIWIDERMDPYKTLPPLFADLDPEESARIVPALDDFDEIKEGGAAMTAYCKLQFSEVPEVQRKALINGLLRYCELDTMAMVMIYEYWKQELQ